MPDATPRDAYELELDKKKQVLQACQQKKGFESCLPCAEFFECKTRNTYVDAVYNSMSKGKTEGGFEF